MAAAVAWDTVRAIRDVQLGQLYTGVTLIVAGRAPDTFADMTGSFHLDVLSTDQGGSCRAPTFHRLFPDGNRVTYGLHTASQCMEIQLGPQRHSPQELRYCTTA